MIVFAWQRSTVDEARLTPVIFHDHVPESVAPQLVATTRLGPDMDGCTLAELARFLPPPKQPEDD